MKNVEINVSLVDNIKLIKKASEEAIEKALEEVGLQIVNYAKLKCVVDTGLLRNSIAYAVSGNVPSTGAYGKKYKADNPDKTGKTRTGTYKNQVPSDKKTFKKVYIGTNVSYAQVVETGGSGRIPKPFLKPAITDHMDEYKQIVKNNLKETK